MHQLLLIKQSTINQPKEKFRLEEFLENQLPPPPILKLQDFIIFLNQLRSLKLFKELLLQFQFLSNFTRLGY